MGKLWTEEEVQFLENCWGNKPIDFIANQLNRTCTSIRKKAYKLNLGSWLDSGDYITLNQLWKTLGLGNGNEGRKTSWIKKRNFPVKYRRSEKRKTQVVFIEDFWKWAKNNLDILDFSNLEPLSLGKEPEWVESKRVQDRIRHLTVQNTDWTTYEDNKLLDMLKSYRYTTKEISRYLHRTEQAVVQRIFKLNIPYRPIPEDRHNMWTEEEVAILKDKLSQGYDYIQIAAYISNHSEKAIKSKVYNIYGVQDLRKVHVIINEGNHKENE